MDPLLEIQNIQAIKRSRRTSKNSRLHLFYFYSLTIITLAILFSAPLWLWSSTRTTRAFLLISLPKFAFFPLTPKFLFIIGNIIVFILVGESKIFRSGASVAKEKLQSFSVSVSGGNRKEATVHENVKNCIHQASRTIVVAEERREIDGDDEEKMKDLSYEYDFNKRADDFIARVNTQRKLEARRLLL